MLLLSKYNLTVLCYYQTLIWIYPHKSDKMTDYSKKQKGEIIYLNEQYGFIKSEEFGSIFFSNMVENLKLLDKVSFIIEESKSEQHKGKLIAKKIKILSNGNYAEHQRLIGKITNWNGKFGFIKSPQLDSDVFLFNTRLIENTVEVKNDDLVVFSPIKSVKNETQLFCFFAYSIEKEHDLVFLYRQFHENHLIDLGIFLRDIYSNLDLTIFNIKLSLKLQILNLGTITQFNLSNLEEILKSIDPNTLSKLHHIIDKTIPLTFQIILFEKGIISTYNKQNLSDYFLKSNSDTKRIIAERLAQSDDLDFMLNLYLENLTHRDKLNRLNNDIKLFLDISHKNQVTKSDDLYEKAKSIILGKMLPKEIIQLWSNDYISDLPEKYIRENIDLGDIDLIDKLTKKQKNTDYLLAIYEEYLLHWDLSHFERKYFEFIRHINTFKQQFKKRFDEIAPAIYSRFNQHQKFILSLEEINSSFDFREYYYQNEENIDVYQKIKFLINKNETKGHKSVNESQLIDYIQTLPWHEDLEPTTFLNDLEKFNSQFKLSISIDKIAIEIFDTMPKYSVHHVKLWLNERVTNDFYDYVGFRNSFNKLNEDEQIRFKFKGDYKGVFDVEIHEISEVVACTNFSIINENKVYVAFVENIYFGRGELKLKKEDGRFTNGYKNDYANTGINRIPKNSKLNKIEIKISVSAKNEIVSVDGLNELFTAIHTGIIDKTLGTSIHTNSSGEKKISYVEDWELRKNIINYLNEKQSKSTTALSVNEPKNHYRRINTNDDVDNYEHTCLYSIERQDGFVIVWENLDFTHDRSTYVFKATRETHLNQLEKIKNAISNYGQFRATLSANLSNPNVVDIDKLMIFKNDLGVITKIKKSRGNNESFKGWLTKLATASEKSIPEIPSIFEIKSLNDDALINTYFSPPFKKNVEKVKVKEETPIFDNDPSKKPKSPSQKNTHPKNEVTITVPKNFVIINEELNNHSLTDNTMIIFYKMKEVDNAEYSLTGNKRIIVTPKNWKISDTKNDIIGDKLQVTITFSNLLLS
jgi:hypothetical protein